MPASFNARTLALDILNRLDRSRITLDAAMEDALGKAQTLEKREKALLYTLAYGVMRHRGRLDWIIRHFSKTRIEKLHPKVLNILRLGLFQILFLDRIPVSAAVNTAVEMAKSLKTPWLVPFVNAVLRKAAQGHGQVVFPDSHDDPVMAIATAMSFPPWLIRRWLTRYGPEKTNALCDYLNSVPPITVRVNTLKIDKEALYSALSGTSGAVGYTPFSPGGITVSGLTVPIEEIECFKDGWFQVQDEAAQLVSFLLSPKPYETVLDACAGRGGKTGHIAELMQNRGVLVAVDRNPDRIFALDLEMKRLGVSITHSRSADLLDETICQTLPLFDRVLIDAPCSGLGVLRRNPDIKWKMQPDQLLRLQDNQIRLLDNLALRVKPGGILVYAVCSMEPEENEEVTQAFLKKHPEFVVDHNWEIPPASTGRLKTASGFLKTMPHEHHMDGFFSIRFKKTG